MRRPYLVPAIALGILSAILIAISLGVWAERPTTIRVAVASADTEDFGLVDAAAKLAKHGRHGLRLKVVPVGSVSEAAHALEQNQADAAVVRPDVAMPDKGETVVLLHKDVALLVAPGGGSIESFADLAGKRIGVVGQRTGDNQILEAALNQYDMASDAITTVPLKADEVSAAFAAKTVDALFVTGQVASAAMQTSVRAVAKIGEGAPVFLPIDEAAAIAERQPAFEAVEVVKGAFGGLPPRPADDINTLGVTTRLVASADLRDSTVGALTRFLLSQRVALAELAPAARRMTAPSTDKGAALPVHPGTAAYIDDEEETFLDQYSDFIYIGAMVLGVFASGLTAIVGRIGASGAVPVEIFVDRLLAILKQVRGAPLLSTLDQYEAEVDAVVGEALGRSSLRALDERKAAGLAMAVDQVRGAIHNRRMVLQHVGHPVANDEPVSSFEPMLLNRAGLEGRSNDR